MDERRRMSTRMDDLPLILGFTVVAFVLGATTPVIVHRLEPEPEPPPAQTPVQAADLQQLRDALGALDRNVADLSKTVSGLTAEVDRLRADVAAGQKPLHLEPSPSVPPPPTVVTPPTVPTTSPPPPPPPAPQPPSEAPPPEEPHQGSVSP